MDERAWFEGAYAQYADFLYRIGRRLLAGRSEDVLCDAIQDVFLTMWNKRAELTAHPNLGGWLVTALKFRLRTDSRRAAGRGTPGAQGAAGDPGLRGGREQLDPAARTAYDRICDAIACYQETLADIQVDQTQVEQILAAIRIDHPEFFWFDGEASFVSTELSGMPVQTSCTLTYTLDRDQISLAGQQIQQYAAACLSSPGVASAQSDYEKIIGVYRYLIENTDYVITEPDQSILSVMRDHEGTCAGYARSFQYLMNYLGIPCTMALGYGASGESHGWNMVQCGGQWYQMDVTWGDPVTPEGQPGTSLQYTYCMVTDQEIYRDHPLDRPIPMPAGTATAYN